MTTIVLYILALVFGAAIILFLLLVNNTEKIIDCDKEIIKQQQELINQLKLELYKNRKNQ